jgi:hypothetical protein
LRSVLALGVAMTSSAFAAPSVQGGSGPIARIDHLLLGVPDLEAATAEFEARTGVRPVYGGKHPTGTHNALAALGDGAYLELIALQPGAASDRYGDLSGLTRPTPVGWAVAPGKSDGAGALRARLEARGFAASPAQPGSRVTPDGRTLSWETFGIVAKGTVGDLLLAPFFIVWGKDTTHPSATSPAGCRLATFSLRGPRASELETLRAALGLEATVMVEAGPTDAMTVELDCPKGRVMFDTGR